MTSKRNGAIAFSHVDLGRLVCMHFQLIQTVDQTDSHTISNRIKSVLFQNSIAQCSFFLRHRINARNLYQFLFANVYAKNEILILRIVAIKMALIMGQIRVLIDHRTFVCA